jgi:hypothetical protein
MACTKTEFAVRTTVEDSTRQRGHWNFTFFLYIIIIIIILLIIRVIKIKFEIY